MGIRSQRKSLAVDATRSLISGAALVATLAFAFAQAAVDPLAAEAESGEGTSGASPLGFADIAQRVTPAVVSISAKGPKVTENEENDRQAPEAPQSPSVPKGSPLDDFLKQFREEKPPPEPGLSQGTGFCISPDGHIITSKHVIAGAEDISVILMSGEKFAGTLVGVDPRTDIALLKVKAEAKTFPYVALADTDPRVGHWVLSAGNAFGLGGTVTAGIVSGQHRDIGAGPYDYLQIDADVNQGNSGGPAFNLEGAVAGMNTAILTPSDASVGIAFAIPASLLKQVVGELKAHGTVDRGWLGVVIQNVNDDIAEAIGLPEAKGAIVAQVPSDGPAAQQDIKPGDVAIELNGQKVQDARDLARKTAELHANTTVKLTIMRNGEKHEVEVTLGKFPSLPGT